MKNCIKLPIIFILLIFSFSIVCAKPIDKKTAQQIALKQANNIQKARSKTLSQSGSATEVYYEMEGDNQTFYVFNIGNNEGFIVVSGDDVTEEILMSCETGHFTEGEMPDNMMSWLEGYTQQINWLRENGITKEQNRRKAGSFDKYYKLEDDPEKAQRLARWGQSGFFGDDNQELYNYGLPQVTNENNKTKTASTGCTVTAVAQFLYYYQWPKEIGPKSISSYKTKTNKLSITGWDKGTKIDWDHINRTYDYNQSYSEEEITAISNLMKMVGASYEADYKYQNFLYLLRI